jgi:CubicO group peptidase (beta-lactamase class C family)
MDGQVDSGFEPVAEAFRANIDERGDTGAAVCVYHRGRKVVDLIGGDYRDDTVQLVRSGTKGVVAIAAHLLWQRGELDFDAPVVDVWPEFGAEGKKAIPIRWLFSHQSGVVAIDRPLSLADVVAWEPVVDALAVQAPAWEPGTRHGYHTLTYGWLAGEVIRRVCGTSVGEFIRDELADPLGLDLWVGLPAEELPRVKSLRAAPPPPKDAPPDPLMAQLADRTSLAARSLFNPLVFADEQTPAYLGAEVPGANGVSNARSLARLYAATIGPVDGVRLLDEGTIAAATAVQAEGMDAVVGYETRYATGFQRPFPLRPMAGLGTACFGHYGMGGPLGFADPETGIGFGYTSIQVQNHPGPDPRTRILAEVARACGS